ncbi:hypothetical protein A9F13_03g01243 [Clavispora lusitaniae]|uniref:Uncharacterized protein n=1 Tax=Clavispora lusitaniae TaxID=36911 RepID=A0AA91T380_CLALS|nr:hypothetical protein A9F13_03g01243 [Clavispora lusitaniae]
MFSVFLRATVLRNSDPGSFARDGRRRSLWQSKVCEPHTLSTIGVQAECPRMDYSLSQETQKVAPKGRWSKNEKRKQKE